MLVVLLLLMGAAATHATAEQTVLCGRELAKAHSMYCYGIDPFPDEAFDSDLSSLSKTGPDFISVPKMPERFAFRARRTAEARLKTADLIEACCLKPCHVNELLVHC